MRRIGVIIDNRCPLGAVGIFNGHFFSYFIGVPHGCQIDLVELFLEVTKE